MSKATILTYTGRTFDILEPTFEMVDIIDIAHAGSQQNRFTGHCRFPYPVSQHERLGSYLVPPEYALRFLLHDASEAYLADMNRPLKHFTPAGIEYCKIEKVVQTLIYEKFGISGPEPACIHEVDNQMLYAEKAQLMAKTPWRTKWGKDQKEAPVTIKETSFERNKLLYLERFFELYQS